MAALLPLLKAPQLPRFSNPGKRRISRKNPEDQIEEALKFYEEFHWGEKPKRVRKLEVSDSPKVGVKLGTLYAVTYETSKGGEKALWEHEFGEDGGVKPDLVMDSKTKKLHIVGGTYTVKAAGIID